MSVMVMTCPHCGADNMTFNVRTDCGHEQNSLERSALAFCAQCDMPVVVKAEWVANHYAPSDWRLHQMEGNLLKAGKYLRVQGVWPEQQVVDAPQHLPEKVARSYMDAANARRIGLWTPACGAYRRCMELALKQFAPDVEAWKLEKRIDKLAAENRITPDLKAWAHELRLDGNEAIHGDDEATKEITDQMHHLTYFLLTYLYTLPKQIEESRARRNGEAGQ